MDTVLTEDSDLLAYGCKKVQISQYNGSSTLNTEKVILLCHYIEIFIMIMLMIMIMVIMMMTIIIVIMIMIINITRDGSTCL